MEKMISDEVTKYLIVLGGAAVGLYIIITKLITKVKGAYKPFQKQTFFYLLVSLLLFALITIIAYPAFVERPFVAFILLQVSFLLLGTIHAYYVQHKIKWVTEGETFVPELLFTLLVAVLGGIAFIFMYRFVNKNGLELIMACSIMFFIIPFFFYNTFLKAIALPPKILKEWFYPLQQEIDDPEESKLKHLLVISFEFKKQSGDPNITNFRAKAPIDMDFGELFYYFINDYNDRHPDSKVQFVNNEGEANGWIFYKKPKWHTVMTNYIDADKTVFNNRIRENDIIICSRSLI